MYSLSDRYTIIDEADEMLHSDWEDEFTRILSGGGMIAHPSLLGFIRTSLTNLQMQMRMRTIGT